MLNDSGSLDLRFGLPNEKHVFISEVLWDLENDFKYFDGISKRSGFRNWGDENVRKILSEAEYEKLEAIKKRIASDGSPYSDINKFVSDLDYVDLEPDAVYFRDRDGEWKNLFEAVSENGSAIGTYTDYPTEKWLEILENIDNYVLKSQ